MGKTSMVFLDMDPSKTLWIVVVVGKISNSFLYKKIFLILLSNEILFLLEKTSFFFFKSYLPNNFLRSSSSWDYSTKNDIFF
jgi:hypothetical protein